VAGGSGQVNPMVAKGEVGKPSHEYIDQSPGSLKREAPGTSTNPSHVIHTDHLYSRKQPATNLALPGAANGQSSKGATHAGTTAKSLNVIQMTNNMQSNQQLGKYSNPNEYTEDVGSRNGQSGAGGQGNG